MAACHLEQHWIGWNRDRWRGDPSLSGGGQLYDSGSHLLDTLLWTTRTTPTAVLAEIDRMDAAVDVNAALSVRLARNGDDPGGVTGGAGNGPGDADADATADADGRPTLTASIGVSGDGPSGPAPGESMRVVGTDGMVSFDGERVEVTESGVTYRATPDDPGFEELTRRKFQNVVDAIRGEADLEIPASDALKVTALTEAAYEAAAAGERVTIDAQAETASDG
jgi:predicted dehydrogenase